MAFGVPDSKRALEDSGVIIANSLICTTNIFHTIVQHNPQYSNQLLCFAWYSNIKFCDYIIPFVQLFPSTFEMS